MKHKNKLKKVKNVADWIICPPFQAKVVWHKATLDIIIQAVMSHRTYFFLFLLCFMFLTFQSRNEFSFILFLWNTLF